MSRVFGLLGAAVGSAIGWWVGAHFGILVAFILSVIGTGAGLYWGRRMAATFAP